MTTIEIPASIEAFRGRIANCISALHLIEAKSPAVRAQCGEVINELQRLHRDVAGLPPVEAYQAPERPKASMNNLVQGNRTRHALKQHEGQRRCPRHDDGDGAWLPLSAFSIKNKATGALKSWCRDCTVAYQRERYVAVTAKTMTVQLIEGDRCVGHDCPACGLPFEIGDRIRGENLHHESCQS